MVKLIIKVMLLFFLLFLPTEVFAQESFVSIVNPIRGNDFWVDKTQDPLTVVRGEKELLDQYRLSATWLIRFDVLSDKGIIELIKQRNDEKGLFLEIIPTWANESGVAYHEKQNWHDAESAFLSGYERGEREKLIDKSFKRFKEVFGFYPKSVGAWWIDSYSLSYMQQKYNIIAALIVADQYTTDNYQIWGKYFGTPYYPAKNNALHPASSVEDKLPIVITQWAARDPVNGYGDGVMQSTFSVQANDYTDFHNLDTKYFSSLVDIYTNQKFNRFGQLNVGLENSYSWSKYANEYENQIKVLVEKQKMGQFRIVTLEDFASWYIHRFPDLSPEHLIVADDTLGTYKKVVWFMNPYYRAGWFLNQDGSLFRDIRQYIGGEEELCFQKRCSSVNFATFATRVLDDVSFGHKLIVDEGEIRGFKIGKEDNFVISYVNEAGNSRKITFLPKDIAIDGKISSIDTTILNATSQNSAQQKIQLPFEKEAFEWSFAGVLSKIVKFTLFLVTFCLIPGLVLTQKLSNNQPIFLKIFLSTVTGFVALTVLFYILSLISLRPLIFLYALANLIIFIRLKLHSITVKISWSWLNLTSVGLILAGTIFLIVPTFKSGLKYPFGLGFWGPNTHDGVWHLSLINQLVKSVPPENPIFAETTLKNYHLFYDLLIAATSFLSTIPPIDLVFRFYPVIFALMLGIGTYYFLLNMFKRKLAVLFGLYFVYFAGSFGWIVSYTKERILAGESAFWANQSISFNLNPPFATSLLIIIALFNLFFIQSRSKIQIILAIVLAGSLIGFKAYGAVLIFGSLLMVGILKKNIPYLLVFLFGSAVSALIFFSNFQSSGFLIFAPFWLIHSMIDATDRVGWTRLSLARHTGLETGNWFKYISSEALSFFIFIAGNLGIRVLSLMSLIKIRKIFRDDNLLFMLFFSFLSFLIPTLFIQSGNPWNTIQFSYYGLYVGSLIAGVMLSYLFFKLPRLLSLIVILTFLVLTPINSVVTATYYTGYSPHARIDPKELEALEFLSNQEDGVVLTYPYDVKLRRKIAEPWPLLAYDSTAYVSAFSKKQVYLEDEPQNQILLTDYKKRTVEVRDFFNRRDTDFSKIFLIKNKIRYIYLPKIFQISLDTDKLELKVIFENHQVVIYKH